MPESGSNYSLLHPRRKSWVFKEWSLPGRKEMVTSLGLTIHKKHCKKNIVFTRSENKLQIFEYTALFTHFLTFSKKEIQSFSVVFESANWSIRSIIQQFSFYS